jgi:hypothetical protein
MVTACERRCGLRVVLLRNGAGVVVLLRVMAQVVDKKFLIARNLIVRN